MLAGLDWAVLDLAVESPPWEAGERGNPREHLLGGGWEKGQKKGAWQCAGSFWVSFYIEL